MVSQGKLVTGIQRKLNLERCIDMNHLILGMSLFSSFFLLLILIVSNSPPSPKAKIGW